MELYCIDSLDSDDECTHIVLGIEAYSCSTRTRSSETSSQRRRRKHRSTWGKRSDGARGRHPAWLTTSTYCVDNEEDESSSFTSPRMSSQRTSTVSTTSSSTTTTTYLVVEQPSAGPHRKLEPDPPQRWVPPPSSSAHRASSIRSTLPPYMLHSKKLRKKSLQSRKTSRSFSETVESLASRAHTASQQYFDAELPPQPGEEDSFFISPIHQRVAWLSEQQDDDEDDGDYGCCGEPLKRRRCEDGVEQRLLPTVEMDTPPSLPPLALPPSRTMISTREQQLEDLFGSTCA